MTAPIEWRREKRGEEDRIEKGKEDERSKSQPSCQTDRPPGLAKGARSRPWCMGIEALKNPYTSRGQCFSSDIKCCTFRLLESVMQPPMARPAGRPSSLLSLRVRSSV